MSRLRLWGRATSGNVQKPMWLLAELGIEHERIDVGGDFGGNDTPAYLAMNPNGRVPVLEDGDTVIWESNAIVRYLAARYGGAPFWSDDPARRASADMWMDWAVTTLGPQLIGLFNATVRTPEKDRDLGKINSLSKRSVRALTILDRHLAKSDWVAGDHLSMGDIPIGTQLYRYFSSNNERVSLPRVEAYYARMCERDPYRETVMTSYESVTGVPPFDQFG
jgi:glutathione S-transferase